MRGITAVVRTRTWSVLAALLVTLVFVTGAIAQPEECGDLDGSGSLVASDALLLLKRAVGQDVAVECPACPVTTTTMPCAELGGQCSVNADCCEILPPPIVGSGTGAQGICCGGMCSAFGLCAGPGTPCPCDASCCSGSCGQQVAGECD